MSRFESPSNTPPGLQPPDAVVRAHTNPSDGKNMARGPNSAPTLSDVAKHAGVSLATASRAINGSATRTVGEGLRQRVSDAASALGYAPNANAQAMARGATRTIGVVVHDLTDPYFAAIADGIATAATQRKLFLTLATTGNDLCALSDVVAALDSMRVRAIILVGARWQDPDLQQALTASIDQYVGRGGRVVALGMAFPGVDCVQVANEAGASSLAEELAALGYRRPLVLAGPELHSTAVSRATAFTQRMAELGHPVPQRNQIAADFTRAGGTAGMRLALESGLRFDVIVAMNDVMALGARNEATRSGLRIPADAGIAGFGDISTLVDVTPGMTTVHVPSGQIARLGLDLALDGPGDGSGSITVEAIPVLRDSTPPRA